MQKYLICGIVARINKEYMIRFKTYSFSLFLLFIISSCSSSTIEEDMKEYCQCIENADKRFERKACRILAQEIQDNYSSDPDAAKYIDEHKYDCGFPRRRGVRLKFR